MIGFLRLKLLQESVDVAIMKSVYKLRPVAFCTKETMRRHVDWRNASKRVHGGSRELDLES